MTLILRCVKSLSNAPFHDRLHKSCVNIATATKEQVDGPAEWPVVSGPGLIEGEVEYQNR